MRSFTFQMCSLQDSFFKENMYANFGDLGIAIKQLLVCFLYLFPLSGPFSLFVFSRAHIDGWTFL